MLNKKVWRNMAEHIDTPNLYLTWSDSPWDAAVTGYPVWQINDIELRGSAADADMLLFEQARDRLGVGLLSCRLPNERLDLSMFLEAHEFRFIEMLYHPELELTSDRLRGETSPPLSVLHATEEDLLMDIIQAERNFLRTRQFWS